MSDEFENNYTETNDSNVFPEIEEENSFSENESKSLIEEKTSEIPVFPQSDTEVQQNPITDNQPAPMKYQPPYYQQNNIPPYNPNFPQGYNPDFSYPPYMNGSFQPQGKTPKKKKGTAFKTVLICISSVLGIISVSLLLFILTRTNFLESLNGNDNSQPPQNSSNVFEPSYSNESKLPDAPDVSADENGPQISTQETSESQTASNANSSYKKVSPSIVCITSYEAGSDYTITESGEGSGIIISSDGYIATNSHVVNDSIQTGVMVTLNTGEQYLGTIIGIDKKTDLAVLKIDANNLTVADFANSEKLIVGQEVYAIGNPGGSAFSNSLTLGTISAINRRLSSNLYIKYIQTDAAINPGNSGGALVNEYGQVIGMNTAKLVGTDYEGMGFAIPSNTVTEIINKLIKYGYVNDRGTLGIEGKTCSLYTSKTKNVPQGMIITAINDNSPLYLTAAKINDIIIAVNDESIKSADEFIDILKNFKPNDTIKLTLFRPKGISNSKEYQYTLDVVLIEETNS